ncbi:hypothetical protein [Gillisia limnaea]|uniref:Uncharacterized protein n=1 Tax=Gillisia limnaea (strain DSM 15749 / LMG 21470 / R-8282) TaxID=865937 RepID=H2BTP1_GILLR|nr:hypothetical protein [Gillisia limnaea]EHQ02661.1 hypothetical protein Gilli_2023 [Gillisia limnaea DSM 15749]
MLLQLEIPKDQQATGEEEWPFNLIDFITDNVWYLGALVLVLLIFFYARNYMKKH